MDTNYLEGTNMEKTQSSLVLLYSHSHLFAERTDRFQRCRRRCGGFARHSHKCPAKFEQKWPYKEMHSKTKDRVHIVVQCRGCRAEIVWASTAVTPVLANESLRFLQCPVL